MADRGLSALATGDAATTILFDCVVVASVRANGTRSELSISWRDAVIIGVAQAVALIPGTLPASQSRPACSRRRPRPRRGFRFCCPYRFRARVLHIIGLVQQGAEGMGEMVVGAVVAAASAFACIHVFLVLLQRLA